MENLLVGGALIAAVLMTMSMVVQNVQVLMTVLYYVC
jgi:hypothetical protein